MNGPESQYSIYDPDRSRWEIGFSEDEVIVTRRSIATAKARVTPLVSAAGGSIDGETIYTRPEEQ